MAGQSAVDLSTPGAAGAGATAVQRQTDDAPAVDEDEDYLHDVAGATWAAAARRTTAPNESTS